VKNKYIKQTHISERKFRSLLRFYAEDIPALTTSHLANVNPRTSQRIYTLLRERVSRMAAEETKMFVGEVEVDESYFGPRRVRGKCGRGAALKIPVIGLHKRGECVYVSVVNNCSKNELMPVIRGHVREGSDVYTDGWRAYDGLITDGYKHHRINHDGNVFAQGRNHVNGIESFWGYAKLRLAKLRGVRSDRFLLHLKETEWRFNHRHDDRYRLLLLNLSRFPL
jgi:transposase-like protein